MIHTHEKYGQKKSTAEINQQCPIPNLLYRIFHNPSRGGMKMTLYQIDKQIMDCIDMDTGELLDIEMFEQLQLDRADKIESIALVYKNKLAELDAIIAERKAFQAREKQCTNTLESLKKYLETALQGEQYRSAKVDIKYRKSEVLSVSTTAEIPTEYYRTKEPEVDKVSLKAAIKSGLQFIGVALETRSNIQIK